MRLLTLTLAFALTPMLLPLAPLAAQRADRVLTIFGEDKCPTTANGDEIVVCARRPEGERYRIPKEFREIEPRPANQSWAVTSQAALATGRTGTGSCSAIGGGGWTGCYLQQVQQARAEAKQEAAKARDIP